MATKTLFYPLHLLQANNVNIYNAVHALKFSCWSLHLHSSGYCKFYDLVLPPAHNDLR